MGLNPVDGIIESERRFRTIQQDILDKSFNGGSPYFDMFRCGLFEVPINECIAKCQRNGIAVRPKDIGNYNNGLYKRSCQGFSMSANARCVVRERQNIIPFDNIRFQDFPKIPINWVPTQYRFFPCTNDNRPMQKWGWSKGYKPELKLRWQAEQLSPCRWVGHNLLYQRFIVMDIDGRGHGSDDLEVIAFGNQFKNDTFTTEDPMKPGSFHLYFETDRLIPVRHFGWAKLDLMGNAVNAAVYFKNKVGNGVPMMKLDESIWNAMMQYQKRRKER